MNDFTKEELQKISIGLTWWFQDSGFMEQEDYQPLIDKIQSMIDTYCEHVNDERFNMLPLPGSPKMCMKCARFYV